MKTIYLMLTVLVPLPFAIVGCGRAPHAGKSVNFR
jgi:hypothetical protein